MSQGNRWLLLAESAVDGTYCGTRLQPSAPHGVYRIRFPQAGEGNHVGEVCPQSTLPWRTPWRVILIADTLAGIVESTLIEDLNPPCAVADTSWIKPGRVSWSWWSDHDSSRDFVKLREFVDLAAEMGWEYSLVDANWTLMDGGDVRQLARYAADKGVGLMLWYNSGGTHNIVTEKPRGCLDQAEVRRFEFQLLNQWGVKGIKVDFFQSDKQNIMQLYHDILRDAAEFKLLVNFHGCTVPRGWSRTCPHLLPGKWLVVARRKGTDWYLGGINGQDQPQPVALDWRFLADGQYALRLIEDGARDRSLADRQLTVDRTQPLDLRLPPRGGFVGGLSLRSTSPVAGG